jgi:hypothetical protein
MRKCTFDPPGVYAPFFQKTNCKFLKSLRKNIHMYISTFYVLMQSFVKNKHLSWPVQKRIKISLTKRLILAPFFVLFTRPT